MQEQFSKTRCILNRVGRFSFIVFVKKHIVIFIFLFLLFLTFLLGLWNVRNIEFILPDGGYTDINSLEKSAESLKGMNIFLISVENIQVVLKEGNGFVKFVTVEKKIPFTLKITIQEYEPKFIWYSSDRCVLFAEEGNRVKELCSGCNEECPRYLDTYPAIYLSSNSALESGNHLIYAEEFSNVLSILSVFGFDISSISVNDGIATFNGVDGHIFVLDLSDDLNIQLSRLYIVGKKINSESIEFKSLDLRFNRPVMKLK
jgi:hypothetical protein